jgi:histidinol-phosphate aminotransferase
MNKTFSLKINKFNPAFKKKPVFDLDSSQLKTKYNIRNSILQNKLKKEIIKYLKIKIDTENIVFGFGSYSILERLAWKFFEKGLMVGEFPQFRYFPMEYKKAGGLYLGFWKKDFSFPFEEIKQVIENKKNLKIIYINNPNNPTGQFWDRNKIIKIIKLAEKKNIFVLVDEVYADLSFSQKSFSSLTIVYKNLIVVRSFSKILGLQNLRVGYMIASPNIIKKYKDICNWDEITNIGAREAIKILQNIPKLISLQKKIIEIKKLIIKVLKEKEFNVIDSNFGVPIMLIKKKGINDLGEYFRRRNIKVEGSAVFQELNNKFPKNYARIRIPLSLGIFNKFKEKL